MRIVFVMFFLITLSCPFVFANPKHVEKVSCINLADHSGKNMDQIKDFLLGLAKRDALSEIYGDYVKSKTVIENFELKSDLVSSVSAGIIRVEGNPSYFNGSNFGEICVKIKAYITDEDAKKFRPSRVELKKYCFVDPNVSVVALREKTKQQAAYEILKSKYTKFTEMTPDYAINFIRDIAITNESIDFNTGAYCMDFAGFIIPFEVENLQEKQLAKKSDNVTKPKKKYKKGDLVYTYTLKEEGDPLTDISKYGMVLKGEIGLYMGTNVDNVNDSFLFELPDDTPESISINFDFWVCYYCSIYVILKTEDGKEHKIVIMAYEYKDAEKNYVILPNNSKTAIYEALAKKWNKFQIDITSDVMKVYYTMSGKNKEFVASQKFDTPLKIKSVKLQLYRGANYANFKVIAL